ATTTELVLVILFLSIRSALFGLVASRAFFPWRTCSACRIRGRAFLAFVGGPPLAFRWGIGALLCGFGLGLALATATSLAARSLLAVFVVEPGQAVLANHV